MYRIVFLIASLFITSACNTLSYYGQAISGHVSLMANSESIDEVLDNPSTSVDLRQRLLLAKSIVEFAEQEMQLPGGGSYQHYVKIEGRYVVWNVVATQALSVEAKQWCYPFAGCVTYRGYYAEQDAREFAQELIIEGLDTTVVGASAYSTLGWLDDPLFSSMMYRDEARLVEVIIHELAHQRLYVSGDTVFNESFASVVAREGVKRWFEKNQATEKYQRFVHSEEIEREFNQLLMDTRERLHRLYTSKAAPQEKLSGKKEIFVHMQEKYRRLKSTGLLDGRYDNWMARPLNNASLALVAAYHKLEPQLEKLLRSQAGDMERFYQLASSYEATTNNNRTALIVGK